MLKFMVGDRIRVVNAHSDFYNTTGTITEINVKLVNDSDSVRVKVDSLPEGWDFGIDAWKFRKDEITKSA